MIHISKEEMAGIGADALLREAELIKEKMPCWHRLLSNSIRQSEFYNYTLPSTLNMEEEINKHHEKQE